MKRIGSQVHREGVVHQWGGALSIPWGVALLMVGWHIPGGVDFDKSLSVLRCLWSLGMLRHGCVRSRRHQNHKSVPLSHCRVR